jgi:hypothetical protein
MLTASNPHLLSADASQIAFPTTVYVASRNRATVRGDVVALAVRCLR